MFPIASASRVTEAAPPQRAAQKPCQDLGARSAAAQLSALSRVACVERPLPNRQVAGSSPAGRIPFRDVTLENVLALLEFKGNERDALQPPRPVRQWEEVQAMLHAAPVAEAFPELRAVPLALAEGQKSGGGRA